jgi:hypothetical protein
MAMVDQAREGCEAAMKLHQAGKHKDAMIEAGEAITLASTAVKSASGGGRRADSRAAAWRVPDRTSGARERVASALPDPRWRRAKTP